MRATALVCLCCLAGVALLVLPSIGCGGGDAEPVDDGNGTTCTPTLDQAGAGGASPRTFGIGAGPRDLGQTITIGMAGTLDSLSVTGFSLLAGTDPLLLEVRSVVGGLPDNSASGLRGSVSLPNASLPSVPGTVIFDLAALGISVLAADQLAFVMRSSGNEIGIDISAGDNYAGGQAVQFVPDPPLWSPFEVSDLGFSLHVCVP